MIGFSASQDKQFSFYETGGLFMNVFWPVN